jgi:hypothetical protein
MIADDYGVMSDVMRWIVDNAGTAKRRAELQVQRSAASVVQR